MSSPKRAKGTSVIIIGAGVGGLACAIALKRKFGLDDFTIYEKASDVGGTWRDNIYPGCASDILVHFYSLSTDLKPDWKETQGTQPEIQAYWKELSRKYELNKHIVFNTKVVSAEWDVTQQMYNITTEDVVSGTRSQTCATVLISALGLLEIPRWPDIPGLQSFKGDIFHSARWNKSIDLSNKRVAVIGNGASATQFVPIITQDPSVQVTQFIRTANWYTPPVRKPISATMQWIFGHVPLAIRAYRAYCYAMSEGLYFTIDNKLSRNMLANIIKKHIVKTAPPRYHAKLIPDYPLGCKRIIVDTDYLSSLHRPNIQLNWDGIMRITDNGITTKDGQEHAFDVIILSTGFTVDHFPLLVKGRSGQTVEEYFQSRDGPSAYLGTTMPGFPNFYTLAGPNTATGHTSVIFFEEVQINYLLQLLEPVLRGTASSFEVTPKATDDYNDKIHRKLAKTVFTHCISWYRTGGEGKVSSIFPGTAFLFYWYLRRPNWQHYIAVGAEKWDRQRRRARLLRWIFLASLVSVGIWSANRANVTLPYAALLRSLSRTYKHIVG